MPSNNNPLESMERGQWLHHKINERLEKRYHVERIGGTPGKHDDCQFFVLDPQHDPFARSALTAYADACQATLPELARDIRALSSRPVPDMDGNHISIPGPVQPESEQR